MRIRNYIAILVLAAFLAAGFAYTAFASTVGPNYPTSAVDEGTVGGGGGAVFHWSGLTNLSADDGAPATASAIASESGVTGNASTTQYGFSIPSTATINGITVEIKRRSPTSGGTVQPADAVVQLLKANALVGTNKADQVTLWTTSTTTITYGGASDLWGTTWTPSDINNTGFGLAISGQALSSSNASFYVDFVRITVTYTPAAAGSSARVQIRSGKLQIKSGKIIIKN